MRRRCLCRCNQRSEMRRSQRGAGLGSSQVSLPGDGGDRQRAARGLDISNALVPLLDAEAQVSKPGGRVLTPARPPHHHGLLLPCFSPRSPSCLGLSKLLSSSMPTHTWLDLCLESSFFSWWVSTLGLNFGVSFSAAPVQTLHLRLSTFSFPVHPLLICCPQLTSDTSPLFLPHAHTCTHTHTANPRRHVAAFLLFRSDSPPQTQEKSSDCLLREKVKD